MTTRITNFLLSTGLTLVLGACGAAATSGAASGASTGAARPGSSTASVPSGSTPAGAPSSGPAGAACSILTMDTVSHATGFAVTQTNGTDAICYYQNADQSQYLIVTLFSSQADMATILQIEPSGEHVTGVGDDAFWVASAGILFVRKGDHGLELLDPDSSFGAGGAASRDALVALARAALPSV
jgi:hypothetical protein